MARSVHFLIVYKKVSKTCCVSSHQQANSVILYASADVKIHPGRGGGALATGDPCHGTIFSTMVNPGWLGSRVVSVLDSGAEGPGFKS